MLRLLCSKFLDVSFSCYLGQGRGLLDCVHRELPDILLRVEQDDVELGAVEAHQGHVGAQADGDAQSGHLNLSILEEIHFYNATY